MTASPSPGRRPGTETATVAVQEWDGEVIFLHEVKKGAADRSYGVQVAQLAGLPRSVVDRARSVLDALERGEREAGQPMAFVDDLPLFSAAAANAEAPVREVAKPSPALDLLADTNPDDLTPRAALELVYRLKDAARE